MVRRSPVSLAVWALVLGTACGKQGLDGNVFRQDDVAFRVGPIPPDWRTIETNVESDLPNFAFRDDANDITIGAAGRCHRDGDDVPLRSLTQHLAFGFTNREIQAEETWTLDGRAALRTEMLASLDGVRKQMVFVVLKKDGCVYDFWRIASGPSDAADFDAFVRGFQVLK